jgi:hypothetical protein
MLQLAFPKWNITTRPTSLFTTGIFPAKFAVLGVLGILGANLIISRKPWQSKVCSSI